MFNNYKCELSKNRFKSNIYLLIAYWWGWNFNKYRTHDTICLMWKHFLLGQDGFRSFHYLGFYKYFFLRLSLRDSKFYISHRFVCVLYLFLKSKKDFCSNYNIFTIYEWHIQGYPPQRMILVWINLYTWIRSFLTKYTSWQR